MQATTHHTGIRPFRPPDAARWRSVGRSDRVVNTWNSRLHSGKTFEMATSRQSTVRGGFMRVGHLFFHRMPDHARRHAPPRGAMCPAYLDIIWIPLLPSGSALGFSEKKYWTIGGKRLEYNERGYDYDSLRIKRPAGGKVQPPRFSENWKSRRWGLLSDELMPCRRTGVR